MKFNDLISISRSNRGGRRRANLGLLLGSLGRRFACRYWYGRQYTLHNYEALPYVCHVCDMLCVWYVCGVFMNDDLDKEKRHNLFDRMSVGDDD